VKPIIGVTADTQVLCAPDNRHAMIVGAREDVYVYSNGKFRSKSVKYIDSVMSANIVILKFNTYTISCGKDTEFLMEDKTFLRCSDIPIGSHLFTLDGSSVVLREFSFYHGDCVPLCRLVLGDDYCGVELPNRTFVRVGI